MSKISVTSLIYSNPSSSDTLENMNWMLRSIFLIFTILAGRPEPVFAQKNNSGSEISPDYAIEIMPFVAKNLPYDSWGTPGTLSVLGIRGAIRIGNPTGALEGSIFYHHAGPDTAYSVEAAYRHEMYTEGFINGYIVIGMHFTQISFEADLDGAGNCVIAGCQTDSGPHYGVTYGGGIMLPVGEYPIKLGLRFYQNPQKMLLLEAGYGIRL